MATLLTVQTGSIELRFNESELDRLSGRLGFDDGSEGERAGGEVG